MRESTYVLQIRTINQFKLDKRQVSVDRLPEEVRIISYACFLVYRLFLKKYSSQLRLKIYLDVRKLVKLFMFVFYFVIYFFFILFFFVVSI